MKNILLIGPRHAGKTTVGRALARRCDMPFVDLDDAVLASFDLPTVEMVWELEGEQRWRDAEVAALRRVLTTPGQIVALGGGVTEIPDAAALLREARDSSRAVVIYLKCPPEVLEARRSAAPGDRPALTGHDPETEIAVVLSRREPRYRELADEVVDSGSGSAEDVAAAIHDRLP